MSIARLINRPCTIVRHVKDGQRDRRGNETTEPIQVETVCELQPVGGFRKEEEAAISDTRWTLFLLPDQELNFGDSVLVEGEGAFEVLGEPWKARNPRTQSFSHIEATLRRTAAADEVEVGS